MPNNYIYAGLAVVVLVLLALFLWPRTPSVPSLPGTVVVNFMGTPIPLTPVGGEDIKCIGAPEGYTRVYYDKSTDVDGTFVQVAYVKEGEYLSSVEKWIRFRASTCGFVLKEETAGSTHIATGKSLEYERNNGNESLQVDVGILRGSDGKVYTFVYFNYTEWNQEAYEEGSESETIEGSTNTQSGQYNVFFQEILQEAFGADVTLERSVHSYSIYQYDFAVSRNIVEEDMQPLIDVFRDRGFALTARNQDGSHVSLAMTKSDGSVTVEFDIGGNTVTVIYVPGGG